ncbi:hypothetical protein ACIRPQ_21805 [Streptomyces sp. NPDC101213]|uniref:hypothetical protein n=1 Tax=Streptomyces sp. NPDC101213 TaxID=3366130 RepID=UPI003824036B
MTDVEGAGMMPLQQATASGQAQVKQIFGDYEEHQHRYVRGWEFLRGVGVDAREMELVQHAFVDSPGLSGSGQVAHAVSRLKRPYDRSRVLVLCGEEGTGLRTAALRVLSDVGVPTEQIRWLVLDWDQPRTEQIPHFEGHGYVLDLTGYGVLSKDFYTGLADYQKEAEAAGAFLIILADPNGWNPGTLTTVPAVPVDRPPAMQVAEAHLRHLAADRLDWLRGAPLDALLAPEAPASDAARLARLIAEAQENGQEAVKQEFTDWREDLRKWFEAHAQPEDLRERAFLVAAALLEQAPVSVVLEAADQLFAVVGGRLPDGGALAGRDLDQRRKAIKASLVNGEDISLEAEQHGLSAAVLKYVWQQRPQLRPVLLEWASRISTSNGINVHHLRRIADCLVQLSLLPGGSTVRSVASTWIDTGREAHRQLAVEILETMALHPVTGVAVRKNLYDWAQQKTVSRELIQAIAEICAGRLGQRYPRIALTRLRLLASRDDELAREAVANAVRTLAGNPEQRLLVLSEIVGWAESTDGTVRTAGARTFLALTDLTSPALLPLVTVPSREADGDPADELASKLFVQGWRAALQEPLENRAARDHLAAWLDSSELSDNQVLPLAAAVLHDQLGKAGTAELLVGSPDSTDLGRTRRKRLIDQLIAQQTASPTESGPASYPGGDGTPAAA